jgi:hypothetical protein
MTSSGVTLFDATLFCELCGQIIVTSWDNDQRCMIGVHRAYEDPREPAFKKRGEQCPNLGKSFRPPAAIEVVERAASFDGVGTPEQDKTIQEFMS